MICAPTFVPIREGSTQVDLLYPHFEPKESAKGNLAFALHVQGLSDVGQTALFALLPTTAGYSPQWFIARWGRTGVGPFSFMPIPAQVEEEGRACVQVYGHDAYNFNWRNCQWEVLELIEPRRLDTSSGETVLWIPNLEAVFALADGLPLVNLDTQADGEYVDGRLSKESEPNSPSYKITFAGRVWRRWLDRPEGHEQLELLAFDPRSAVLEDALDEVWGDIGGQNEAKRELIRAIQWPVLYPELFLLFKRRRSRGVLLYGPPGCGKTLLGKAVVKLLAALYNRRAEDGGFQYVKGHQLLDQFVGNSEKAVKALFDEARRWREQKGYPSVLFFDEADALFKRRPAQEQSFTLVPALLAEMDGMDDSGAFVILATNRPDALDPAITRPGRIDRRIRIQRPDQEASSQIFRIHLEGVYLEEGLTVEELSAFAAAELFQDHYSLYELSGAGRAALFHLRDLASGALIHNIVDRATANKMEYCIENDLRAGLSREDLRQATSEVFEEQRESKHPEELEEFAERWGGEVVQVRKL